MYEHGKKTDSILKNLQDWFYQELTVKKKAKTNLWGSLVCGANSSFGFGNSHGTGNVPIPY